MALEVTADSSVFSWGSELVRDLTGTAADDTIIGGGTALRDRLFGVGGNDTLVDGPTATEFSGGFGFDYASYSSASAGVVASLTNPNANTGDAAGDSYNSIEGLIGSAFADTPTGDDFVNTLQGGGGDDRLDGKGGHDTLDGGAGDDTAVFSESLDQHTLMDFGNKIVDSGPDGTDTLTGAEHLQFQDGTINPVDGNALFDTIYYMSHNIDVFHAGANALDHFNTFGRHEGRDPNAFFDTSGYLAVNKDVAAGGANPLEHYHQIGRHEGRDPSAAFDTTLYLIHNPDVAAAGVDPLEHFLQLGIAEGPRRVLGNRTEHRRRLRLPVLPAAQSDATQCRNLDEMDTSWM